MTNRYDSLCAEKALIWRIVHRHNLPWVLDNGLHCGNGGQLAPNWVSIGNTELIDKRRRHPVPQPPGGVLGDYVPFYFTPFSPMLRNIQTGWGGVQRLPSEDILILVSDLHHLTELQIPFLFTDSHAYYRWARFYSDLTDLDKIDWPLLRARDFSRDANDPAKFERYQAEALVHRQLPLAGLRGIICYADNVKAHIEHELRGRGLALPVHVRQGWYF